VLGSAGSDEKVAQAKARYGYDEAWNYKTTSTEEALTRFAPEGVGASVSPHGAPVGLACCTPVAITRP